jgi:Zn-dependent protease
VFNLFPLPPLDGGRILVGLLPTRQALAVSRLEPYGFFIVIALVYFQILTTWWMRPLTALTEFVVIQLLSPLAMLVS